MAYPTVNFRHTSMMGAQPINETSTTQNHPLGVVVSAFDTTYGYGRFIYTKGVASTAVGDLCCYDTANGDTARAVHGGATSYGPCGVAMSANVASQYGWLLIEGAAPVTSAAVAADAPLYLTSTAGSVDDAIVSGDLISGLVSRSATSSGYTVCQISNPSIGATTGGGTGGSRSITLSAATEAADAIVVTGQVVDALGANISAATQVLVRTLAATANNGDITVTAGTDKKTVNPATGENVSWIETTATGGFAVSVANTAVEGTLIQATADGAVAATLKLVFT